ncbi:MAG: hypothetical protein PSV46_23420 [Reyranella sp.]|nr:hypothetical protein [Reyranella sp.]
MTAEEALEKIETYGDFIHVPQIYRDMGLTRLRILVAEAAKPPQPSAMDRMPVPRLNYNPLDRALGRPTPPAEKEPDPAEPEAPPTQEPKTLVHRAIAKEGRLSTPGRRRAAFRSHLARCPTITEAAARTGVDRRTVARWRKTFPAFDAMCRAIIETRRQEAVEDAVLAAAHVEVRPVFYRGKKVGQHTRRDRATGLYLLKQADAAALRAEHRAEQRRAADADFDVRVAAAVQKEVERQISKMSRPAGPQPAQATGELPSADNDMDAAGREMARAR